MSSSFPQQLILCWKAKDPFYLINRSLIKAHHLLNKYCAYCWQDSCNKENFQLVVGKIHNLTAVASEKSAPGRCSVKKQVEQH